MYIIIFKGGDIPFKTAVHRSLKGFSSCRSLYFTASEEFSLFSILSDFFPQYIYNLHNSLLYGLP